MKEDASGDEDEDGEWEDDDNEDDDSEDEETVGEGEREKSNSGSFHFAVILTTQMNEQTISLNLKEPPSSTAPRRNSARRVSGIVKRPLPKRARMEEEKKTGNDVW